MTKRVVLHFGFYKTGTSTVQSYLERRRIGIGHHARVYIRTQLEELGEAGHDFGAWPSLRTYWRLKKAARKTFNEMEAKNDAMIVASREAVMGSMPGWRRYGILRVRKLNPQMRISMRLMAREARRAFGKDCDIRFVFTTRNFDEWLRSVWGHVVAGSDLTEDFQEFCRKYRGAWSLEEEVESIRRALPADIKVVSRSLESMQDEAAGPAKLLLDELDMKERFSQNRPMEKISNIGADQDLILQYLMLNRSGLKGQALIDAKAEAARRAGFVDSVELVDEELHSSA